MRGEAPGEGSEESLADIVRERGAALLDALEAHLPGSREHADATAGYAFATAVGMGLGREAADLCRETARLHDVGMVYVPAGIARTPFDRLDESGREVFEGHYEAGAKLALGAGIPDDTCGWLLQLRERFDGGGPDGLSGDAIPIAARVARAACACDTLLASAAAGESLDARRRAAVAALRGAAGRELDPNVVDALVATLDRQAA